MSRKAYCTSFRCCELQELGKAIWEDPAAVPGRGASLQRLWVWWVPGAWETGARNGQSLSLSLRFFHFFNPFYFSTQKKVIVLCLDQLIHIEIDFFSPLSAGGGVSWGPDAHQDVLILYGTDIYSSWLTLLH